MLNAHNAVPILNLTIETLGEKHFITKGVTHFVMMILETSYYNVMHHLRTNKLRKMIKNSARKDRKCMIETKRPSVCLCCELPITDLHQKDLSKRLAPIICCGMMLHLTCMKALFKSKLYPKCPACKTIFSEGEIDTDMNLLDSTMTIRYLENYGVHPLPYRVKSDIWQKVRDSL